MNKFEEWLNGGNTIAVASSNDFDIMRKLCEARGIDFFNNAFWHKPSKPKKARYRHLLELAKYNGFVIDEKIILVEYQLNKGVTFGYKTLQESSDWYEKEPYTIEEVLKSMELKIEEVVSNDDIEKIKSYYFNDKVQYVQIFHLIEVNYPNIFKQLIDKVGEELGCFNYEEYIKDEFSWDNYNLIDSFEFISLAIDYFCEEMNIIIDDDEV